MKKFTDDIDNNCKSYSGDCPQSCKLCSAAGKCGAFKDENYECSTRNCKDTDPVERRRVVDRCAKTCCDRNMLN